uniref:Uncharacterized protein n=1 Tax=Rhizophora mucronata TaxID=61149 RepID=A0A2P2KMX2_RHIMU
MGHCFGAHTSGKLQAIFCLESNFKVSNPMPSAVLLSVGELYSQKNFSQHKKGELSSSHFSLVPFPSEQQIMITQN